MKIVILCVALAAVVSATPTLPSFKAPFSYSYDNYLMDADSVSSYTVYNDGTNELALDWAYGAGEGMLIRGDLNASYVWYKVDGETKCMQGAYQSFSADLTWSDDFTFIDQSYMAGKLVNHFALLYPQNRRIGAFFDAETGFPVQQQPTFQFATMLWTYFNFSTAAIDSSVFDVPSACSSDKVEIDFAGVYERVMGNPNLRAHFGKKVEFAKFQRDHGKDYADSDERAYRFGIFSDIHDAIEAHNADETQSYTMGLNFLADMTPAERSRMHGRYIPSKSVYDNDVPFIKRKGVKIPTTLDWVAEGVVPLKPRNQGMCGSCWSFGALESLSAAHYLKYGVYEYLSTQNMVDCAWKFGGQGCDGATARIAWQTIMDQGTASADVAYPYRGVDGNTCMFNSTGKGTSNVTVSSYQAVPSGDIDALYQAIQNGPLAIAIDAETLGLNFYTGGVYDSTSCLNGVNDLDHEVMVVGYGVDNGQAYWLVRNSWGVEFGSDGYIKIAVEGNICGVATDAVLPVV